MSSVVRRTLKRGSVTATLDARRHVRGPRRSPRAHAEGRRAASSPRARARTPGDARRSSTASTRASVTLEATLGADRVQRGQTLPFSIRNTSDGCVTTGVGYQLEYRGRRPVEARAVDRVFPTIAVILQPARGVPSSSVHIPADAAARRSTRLVGSSAAPSRPSRSLPPRRATRARSAGNVLGNGRAAGSQPRRPSPRRRGAAGQRRRAPQRSAQLERESRGSPSAACALARSSRADVPSSSATASRSVAASPVSSPSCRSARPTTHGAPLRRASSSSSAARRDAVSRSPSPAAARARRPRHGDHSGCVSGGRVAASAAGDLAHLARSRRPRAAARRG